MILLRVCLCLVLSGNNSVFSFLQNYSDPVLEEKIKFLYLSATIITDDLYYPYKELKHLKF